MPIEWELLIMPMHIRLNRDELLVIDWHLAGHLWWLGHMPSMPQNAPGSPLGRPKPWGGRMGWLMLF
jgi:hypothetical protein